MPHLPPILRTLPELTLSSVIDIAIVAFLLYQGLMVVRGTRAGHILVGILVMVGLYGLAVWLGLEALRSLLSFIVPYLGLAIIVLFQSEIRRTLARIGRKRWLSGGFRAPESIDEIVLAVEELASRKIGALIILERDIGLRTFVESGVRLDAQISRDLLISIFQPGLPLHDGAVIVQKDRIAAAACFLPLTTNPTLSRNLGTRHRAAIGITEETDCLSIVVSEETGRISAAAFGELSSGSSLAELIDRIHEHFGLQGAALADYPGPHLPAEISAGERQQPEEEKVSRS
jgi:diadenylate cyclase